jgi:hypothetical protein
LQELGTEKIRAKNPDFWVYTVIRLVDAIGDDFDYILIDDARFPNEVYRWQQYDYNTVTIRLNRLDYKSTLTAKQKKHESEIAMDNFEFDRIITASDISELINKIRRICDGM